MKLLIYDVETANTQRSSICEIGWIALDNDTIVDSDCTFINPNCSFDVKNVQIHHIDASAVANAPSFEEYYNQRLAKLFQERVILAHNAAFDISATASAMKNAGIELPRIIYTDTIPIVKAFAEAKNYKLTTLAKAISFEYGAHNALEDCRALLAVLEHIRDAVGLEDIISLVIHSLAPIHEYEVEVENTPKLTFTLSFNYSHAHCTDEVKAIDDKLKGLRFCLTGECATRQREDVEREILAHGGLATGAPSKKTNYLVVGTYGDFGDDYISSKQRKVMEYNAAGAHIVVISYADLFAMMEEGPNA